MPKRISNKKFKEMGLEHLRNQYPGMNWEMSEPKKKKHSSFF